MIGRFVTILAAATLACSPAAAGWTYKEGFLNKLSTDDGHIIFYCGPTAGDQANVFMLQVTLADGDEIPIDKDVAIDVAADGAEVISTTGPVFISQESYQPDPSNVNTRSADIDRRLLAPIMTQLSRTKGEVSVELRVEGSYQTINFTMDAGGLKEAARSLAASCVGGVLGAQWQVEEVGGTDIFVTLQSEEGFGAQFLCLNDKSYVTFRHDAPVSEKVRYRLDDGKPVSPEWGLTEDKMAAVPGSGSPAIQFMKSLLNAQELVFELTPMDGSTMVLHFDLSGAEGAMAPLRERCGW